MADDAGVFVDTNLGTHLAIGVSPDITLRDFKRKFEREHFICFSESGEIEVSAFMLRRKSFLYHLPDSMTIKSAFRGVNEDTWFLHAEARALSECNRPCLPNCVASKIVDQVSDRCDVSCPSDLANFVTSTVKSNTKSHRRRRRERRLRCPKNFIGKLGKLFYFTKKRKRRKTVSLAHKVDRVEKEILDVSCPSDLANFVTSTVKSNTNGHRRRRRQRRLRCPKTFIRKLIGKLGKLFYFTKKRKRRKTVSLAHKVDRVEKEILGPNDTTVNKTCYEDCTSRNEDGLTEECLASTSSRAERTDTSSEALVSVSGIINKYFSNLCDDGDSGSPSTPVTSRVVQGCCKEHLKNKAGDICSSSQISPSPLTNFPAKSYPNLLPRQLQTDVGGRQNHNKPEVGKRLLIASYSLGISPSRKHPVSRLSSLKQGKTLAFEVSDDEAVSE